MCTPRDKLLKEYAKRFNSRFLLPFRISGFLRFEMKDGIIVKKSLSLLWINLTTILLFNICTCFVYYDLEYVHDYLMLTDTIVLLTLNGFQNLNFINIFTFNRNSGIKLLNNCIEIDVVLGPKETRFMRVISGKVLITTSMFVMVFQVMSMCAMIISSPPYLGVIIYCNVFILLLLVFYDFCFFFTFWIFLTLRVKYLNVALMKYANLQPEIFPKDFIFDTLLWRDNFNDFITFQDRSGLEQFQKAFNMIFHQHRRVQKSFRFIMLTGLIVVLITTFTMVQAVIIYLKSTNINPLRIFAVTSWVFLGWAFIIGIVAMTSTFYEQIKLTKLICTYVKLNIETPEETSKLMTGVFNVIKYSNTEISIYGIYNLNAQLITKVTLSMMVYVTFQLQLAFSGTSYVAMQNKTRFTDGNS